MQFITVLLGLVSGLVITLGQSLTDVVGLHENHLDQGPMSDDAQQDPGVNGEQRLIRATKTHYNEDNNLDPKIQLASYKQLRHKFGLEFFNKHLLPVGYELVEDIGIFKTAKKEAKFTEARSECIKEGGDLIKIDSLEKRAYVQAEMVEIKNYWLWIGIEKVDGEWQTRRGVPVSNVPLFVWAEGEPANTTIERAGAYTWGSPNYFGAATKSDITRAYICELPW